jgi:hypothetical protein
MLVLELVLVLVLVLALLGAGDSMAHGPWEQNGKIGFSAGLGGTAA